VLDDLHHARAQARRAVDQGRLDEAEAILRGAAEETHVGEQDYASILAPLAQILERRGDLQGSLSVLWCMASSDAAVWAQCKALLPKVPPADRARTLAATGDLAGAAREMEAAGRVAAAAIYREQAEDWSGARALWSRLAQTVLTGAPGKPAAGGADGAGASAYDAALVQCNLARCARRCGDPRQAHDAVVLAVRLLEEAADHFEAAGLRERAFDCFQVLIQLGREHSTFEDVVEGFVNCIRILREDHLKDFALQFLDDAIALAREKDELSAAATLALEAGQYARAVGRPADAARYVTEEAALWRDAARQHVARGDSPEISENALLAAVVAFGAVGQFARVGALYAELGALELPASRRAHYGRAAQRYEGVRDDAPAVAPRPPRTRSDSDTPEVWHVDLLEWEQAGSASECCADILVGRSPDTVTRRRALLGRLTACHAEATPEDSTPESVGARVRLADQLAQIQSYAVLSPLERLWRSPHRPVRIAVLSALQRLFFKRSFITVRAGLADPDLSVADHAATAVEALYFRHAFDPLSRIVRETPSPRARASAIKALARVDTDEAAEFLLGILRHGTPADREIAARSLRDARGASFASLASAELASGTPAMQAVLRQIVGDG
jgi:tetratricopeptide (TPR) repeat protein